MSNELELMKKNVGQFLALQDASLELVQTEEGPVANIGEMQIPVYEGAQQLLLVQPGAVAGDKTLGPHINKYYIKGFEESFAKLTVIPVCVVNYSRVLFDGEYKAGEKKKALCRSGNGTEPHKAIEVPINPVCAVVKENTKTGGVRFEEVCDKAKFITQGQPPECSLSVTIAFLVAELDYAPVFLTLHGKSLSPFNKFQKLFKETSSKARMQRKSIKDYVVELGVDVQGTYSTPTFALKYSPELAPRQYTPLVNLYAATVFQKMAADAESYTPRQDSLASTETIEALPDTAESAADAADSFNLSL